MANAAKKKKNNEEDTRDIETTLSDLQIDKGATAAEAAEAAAEAAGTTVALPDPDNPPPANQTEESDDEEEEEEEVATSTVVDVVQPEPPPPPPMVPPPKQVRPRKRPTPTGTKMSKGVADKMPGAEKIKIYKRRDGQRWLINDFAPADLTGYDAEGFLKHFIQPKWGSGEYDIVGVNGAGSEAELGTVRLLPDPTEAGGDAGAINLVKELLTSKEKSDAEWRKKLEEGMTGPNPIDMLKGVMDVTSQMKKEAAPPPDNSSNDMMAMFMAAMQQQNQTMIALLTKPKEEDPLTKILLTKLLEEKDGGGAMAPLPPPPPPPVQSSPAEMLTAMAGFMQVIGGGGGGETMPPQSDAHAQFLERLLLAREQDGFSTKDIVQLLLAKQQGEKTDDFRSAVDNMAAIMNIANMMNRQNEGAGQATFFDAISALVSNRDFAGSIASAVRAKTAQAAGAQNNVVASAPPGAVNATPQQQQRAPANAQEAVAMLDQEQERLAQHQRALYAKKMQIVQAMQASQQGAAGGAPVAPAGASPGPHVVNGAPPGAVSATPPGGPPQAPVVSRNQPVEEHPIPRLPPTTPDYINRLATAVDEGALIAEAIALLIHLGEHDQWRPFTETLLHHIRSGNKQGTLEYLHAFFMGLAEIEVIDEQLAEAVVVALNKNFAEVVQELSDMTLDGDELITGDDLLGNSLSAVALSEVEDASLEEPDEPA